MTDMKGALDIRNVTIRLRGSRAALIEGLNLTIAPGSVATVMGPSGSGKSTLLAFLSGFIDRAAFQAEGAAFIDAEEVTRLPSERRRLGLLFQDALLFPHLSVGGNLLFGLPRRAGARGRAERARIVAEGLERAGLGGFERRDPATLSGGQRARAALLRTLLAEPRALLLDEPFSKLDATLREDFRSFVFAQARARGTPTLLVTHDALDAKAAGGPILRLGAG